ncbi:DUF1345 domain-containing protein [Micromonospora sonneratiae]|uniref:DUF1345 domain-containing protein n=1 Tax=Micromonospora sonneratiae TaxID=1184706 RepID=A0ABW3Y8I6_9ACTN
MAVAGVCAGGLFGLLHSPKLAPLVGWDVAALTYLTWAWAAIWPMDPKSTARLAVREEPNLALRDTLLLVACVASLLAIGVVLAGAESVHGHAQQLQIGLGIGSVLLSWTIVHTVYTARYARLYYTGPDGGINFNQHSPPRYSDFAYVSFTIGMTFQVSDTNLTSNQMRTTAMRHALLSYLFGAVIIASTINLIAGLVR